LRLLFGRTGSHSIRISESTRCMQGNRQMPGEMMKVFVCGVDGKPVTRGDRTDEEVGIRALKTSGPAYIKKPGCCNIILCCKRKIRECGKVFLKPVEMCRG